MWQYYSVVETQVNPQCIHVSVCWDQPCVLSRWCSGKVEQGHYLIRAVLCQSSHFFHGLLAQRFTCNALCVKAPGARDMTGKDTVFSSEPSANPQTLLMRCKRLSASSCSCSEYCLISPVAATVAPYVVLGSLSPVVTFLSMLIDARAALLWTMGLQRCDSVLEKRLQDSTCSCWADVRFCSCVKFYFPASSSPFSVSYRTVHLATHFGWCPAVSHCCPSTVWVCLLYSLASQCCWPVAMLTVPPYSHALLG